MDPLGNLVKVTYTAGIMGYTETREVVPNFVEIRSRPAVAKQVVSKVVQVPKPAVQKVQQVVQQVQPVVQKVLSWY